MDSMTGRGFCVVAALSNQISGLPLTSRWRIGKSRRTASTGKATAAGIGGAGRVGGSASQYLLVVMVFGHLDVLQHGNGVVDEDGGGEVGGDQVGGDALLVDAHRTHREAGLGFTVELGRPQPDHALLGLTDAHEQNAGGTGRTAVDGDLVGGQ